MENRDQILDDIDHVDHLIDQLGELLLPSVAYRWNIRAGNRAQNEAMLQAKGDLIRALAKLDRVRGLYPVE
ncbi:MAG: hypothetical protein EOL92_00515 [Bacteroidia bacterium]|nr:hypothetical protein [Bacteroidia bacterium]